MLPPILLKKMLTSAGALVKETKNRKLILKNVMFNVKYTFFVSLTSAHAALVSMTLLLKYC
jgi:hypothetical protein